MAKKDLTTNDPEWYKKLCAMVEDGYSINAIMKSLNMDHRTIKRYFPEYRPFRPGGWRDEGGAIRETNRQLDEFLRRGKIGNNRDAGFGIKGKE